MDNRDRYQEGKQLYGAGRLRGVWRQADLLTRLQALEIFRKTLASKRKHAWIWLGCGIGAVIIVSIARSFIPWDVTPLVLAGRLVLYGCLISVVVAIVRLAQLRKTSCDEDATAVLAPLARCLGPDLAPDASLKVDASLKLPTDASLKVGNGPTYSTPTYYKCVDNFFKREILSLACRLRDGTRVVIAMNEQTIEKVLRKKTARGKYKTKTKLRRKITIKARLMLDESRCRLTGNVRLPAGALLDVRQHPRGTRILLTVRKILSSTDRLDAGPILAALAGVYEGISAPQRKSTAATGGTP